MVVALTQNTKSLDGSSDLLRWVAEHVLSCHRRLLADELPAVLHPHTKVPCSELAATLEQVELGVGAAAQWLEAGVVGGCHLVVSDRDKVMVCVSVDETRGVVCSALEQLREVHTVAVRQLQEVEGGFSALLRWYGEQTSAWGSDAEFWADMASFATRFTAACRAVVDDEK